VYNTDCQFATKASLRKSLFDVLWPSDNAPPSAADPAAEPRAQSLAGTYMAVRRARSDFTVMGAAASQLTIKAQDQGKLLVHWPEAGRALLFLPRGDGTWINPDFQLKAAALADAQGQPSKFAIGIHVFERVAGSNEWSIWSAALGLVVVASIIALWAWFTGFLSRRFLGEPQTIIKFWPRATAFVAASLTLGCLVVMASLLEQSPPLAVFHGPSPLLTGLLATPIVVALLAIPMVIWSVGGFGDGTRARLAQVGYFALTVAILIFLAFAWQWGLHPFGLSR
ncbi:MAG: hypothetical protein ABL996_24660, partial [Micropepsaceae bacterium]